MANVSWAIAVLEPLCRVAVDEIEEEGSGMSRREKRDI